MNTIEEAFNTFFLKILDGSNEFFDVDTEVLILKEYDVVYGVFITDDKIFIKTFE